MASENKVENGTTQTVEDDQNNASFIKSKNMKLAFHYLVSNFIYISLVPLLAMTLPTLFTLKKQDLVELWNKNQHFFTLETITITSFSLVLIATNYFLSRPRKVYLVDFSCYKPGPDQKVTTQYMFRRINESDYFNEESITFMRKILARAGYSQVTYSPKGLLRDPPDQSLAEGRRETESVMFGAVDELLSKTGVNPREIGILVVNSSLFNPTPSLSATVVNRYKLRSNILSYSLGGMGCSAGLIAIDLAKRLLQVERNTYALVVSTENITLNGYTGNNRHMLVTNCLFRLGGAAVLLSNRSSERRRSKYELTHSVRVHKGEVDRSYNCVEQKEDDDGKIGIYLSMDLMEVAGDALKANITKLAPLVLPLSEKLLFLYNFVARKILKKKDMKPYVPDLKLAFEHFCLHAGGRAVLDQLEPNLGLNPYLMEPARMTLYRFGNTSSSSLWYELAYFEAKGRIKRGDRVWQIGFGSGFKCNSVVWKALRNIDPANEKKNPWIDEIHEYPVEVPKYTPIVAD